MREWKLRVNWPGNPAEFQAYLKDLKQKTGLSELTLRVCVMRGYDTPEAIDTFLNPKLESLTDPFLIKDMDKAVQRLTQARELKEKTRIYGDYDVDGTCGAALLSRVFEDLDLVYDATQPDRFKDGYGLNVGAVEQAHRDGVKILVTVDCGITSFDAARKAEELGIEMIIVDHHQVDPVKGTPPAYAIVNPQQADCPSGLKQLCGCGLAFYVAMALRSHGRKEGWFENSKEPNLKQHLDLVVIATAADQVPLTGDNRILVRHGMDVLKRSAKPGVRALMEVAGLAAKTVSPGHLGFVLGPRINASGRLASASHALNLLTTKDAMEGLTLAQELESLNKERADIQNKIWDEVRLRVEQGIAKGIYQNAIVVADANWHEGVVGIVASRVTETFHRPAIVMAIREDHAKGSARSYAGTDVLAAIRECAGLLLGFGGHKYAAGLSLNPENLEAFTQAFDEAVSRLRGERTQEPLLTEGMCDFSELQVKALEEMELLGPFGPGNPEPVFTMKASVRNKRVLKDRHFKLDLASPTSSQRSTVEAIWFNAAEKAEFQNIGADDSISEWAGVPELNRFRGRVSPSFRVRDIRISPKN